MSGRGGPSAATAATAAGFAGRRYTFALYPDPAQEAALLAQAALVRALQNALNAIIEARHLRRLGGDPAALAQALARCDDAAGRAALAAAVANARANPPCLLHAGARDDPACTDWPSAREMARWIKDLRAAEPAWRALSTHTPRRVAEAVDRAWAAFFRTRKTDPARAGRPRRRGAADDLWVPHVHLKRRGDIGTSGSGCRIRHVAGRRFIVELMGVPGAVRARGRLPVANALSAEVICGRFVQVDVIGRARARPEPEDAALPPDAGRHRWHLSACVHVRRRRHAGTAPLTVELDLVDGFARVNGVPARPAGLAAAQALEREAAALRAARDRRWPRAAEGGRLPPGTHRDPEWRAATAAIARAAAKAARRRRDALHVFTSRLVAAAAAIELRMPALAAHLRTPRGDARAPGAAVAAVSALNRHTLGCAPGALRRMLEYKCGEAGIPFRLVEDTSPAIAVGPALVETGRRLRRLARRSRKGTRDERENDERSHADLRAGAAG